MTTTLLATGLGLASQPVMATVHISVLVHSTIGFSHVVHGRKEPHIEEPRRLKGTYIVGGWMTLTYTVLAKARTPVYLQCLVAAVTYGQ